MLRCHGNIPAKDNEEIRLLHLSAFQMTPNIYIYIYIYTHTHTRLHMYICMLYYIFVVSCY